MAASIFGEEVPLYNRWLSTQLFFKFLDYFLDILVIMRGVSAAKYSRNVDCSIATCRFVVHFKVKYWIYT